MLPMGLRSSTHDQQIATVEFNRVAEFSKGDMAKLQRARRSKAE